MKSNILIVEDDDALVRSIERNLTARRYDVRSAGSVEEALNVLHEASPNLLLLDIDLPDGSGWEVLRAVRSAGGDDIPVIVLSGMRPNQKYLKELRCSSVLEKPFPMEALLRQVAAHLGESTNGEQASERGADFGDG
jgi:two-component system, OmpR family, KDP operon response regulator KdpE